MGKRHNRKRTRSRPRHRDTQSGFEHHSRSSSVDTVFPCSAEPLALYHPLAYSTANRWDRRYSSGQEPQYLMEQGLDMGLEDQRLRYFGGEPGDEVSLLAPMLKVVTDLFDGHTDYEDPW